jgi:hypothetical protein
MKTSVEIMMKVEIKVRIRHLGLLYQNWERELGDRIPILFKSLNVQNLRDFDLINNNVTQQNDEFNRILGQE